jgi:hypothetical protein
MDVAEDRNKNRQDVKEKKRIDEMQERVFKHRYIIRNSLLNSDSFFFFGLERYRRFPIPILGFWTLLDTWQNAFGRVISSSQRPLPTQENTTYNTKKNLCPQRYSKPRSQQQSGHHQKGGMFSFIYDSF